MKTTEFKKAWHNTFVEGNATLTEIGQIFLVIGLPILAFFILYIATHPVILP